MSSDDAIQVRQSAQSASRYESTLCGREIAFIFLSSAKGRMDFTAEHEGKPLGKFNVLSQHSLARLAKALDLDDSEKDDFIAQALTVGIKLRDGEYIPAPIPDRIEIEVSEYEGRTSSFGLIEADTVGEFLSQPDLLDRINDILHHSRDSPFVGDDANLLLTFLVFLSCKTENPLNLEMIGASSSGKTYLTLTARNGFPKSMCMVLAGASKEALKYDYDEVSDDGEFIVNVANRCIVILEKDESFAFIRRMKPLMSGDDKELVWKTPIKNEMTGEIETRDFIIRGQPSFITLTTRNPSEAEQITRQLLMTPDTTPEKVEAVVSNTLLAKARPEDLFIHEDLHLLQASMLKTKKRKVRNIFAPLMAEFFPAKSAQHQRDITKVLSIIDTITLLHQNQRPTHEINDETWVLSSIEDNVLGLILCDLVLRASLSGVPEDSWVVFNEMKNMTEASRALTEDAILQWLHIHAFSCSKNALKEKHLPTLEDAGLIEIKKRGGGRGGGRKTWNIVKTRTGLMDTYALAPLFIEATRKNLVATMVDFHDILSKSIPAESNTRLVGNEADLLKSIGCSSKTDSLIWRSLVLPKYLRQGVRGVFYDIVGDSPHRPTLFGSRCSWLDDTIESTATEALEAKREVREKVQQLAQSAVESNDEDFWENLANAHLDTLDDEYSAS
jgi:hypothetical protein